MHELVPTYYNVLIKDSINYEYFQRRAGLNHLIREGVDSPKKDTFPFEIGFVDPEFCVDNQVRRKYTISTQNFHFLIIPCHFKYVLTKSA